MFTPSLGFVFLFVSNPQKSSLFYQEIFGIKSIEKDPTFVMFVLKNGVMLGLWSKYTAEPHVKAPASALEICFSTEDVYTLYEDWGVVFMNLKKIVILSSVCLSYLFGDATVSSYNCGGLKDHYDYLRAVAMHKVSNERYNVEPTLMAEYARIQELYLKILFSKDSKEQLLLLETRCVS